MYNPTGSDVLNLSNSDRSKLKGKKIAIVANCGWNIFNFRLNVVNALVAKGAQVIIIAPYDTYTERIKLTPLITLVPISNLRRSGMNPFIDFRLLREFIKVYRKHKPYVIIHYTIKPNIYGAIAARYLGIPSLSVVTGLGYSFLRTGILNKLITIMYKFAFQFPKLILFENKDDKDLFVNTGLIKSAKAYHLNGCGVNLKYFTPKEPLKENETISFAFIGRLLYDKGVVEFIKSAELVKKINPDITFTIIGMFDPDNPGNIPREALQALLQNTNIVFKENVGDIRTNIAESSCIVLPSYGEGMPRILMEAMAMAKPIITTDTPGCRDLVEAGSNGYLVKSRDLNSLVEAMLNLTNLSTRSREQMGTCGRKKAELKLDDQLIASQITGYINDVIIDKS